MNNSIPPVVSIAIIAVVVILIGVGLYKAIEPPQYGPDTHGGQPYGAHMPPAAYFHRTNGHPTFSTVSPTVPGNTANTGGHP